MSYVTTKMLDLDLEKLNKSCYKMYLYIKKNFTADGKTDYSGQSTLSTRLYAQYNLMMYPQPQFHELYRDVQTCFHEVSDSKENHYAQFWLNFYRNGEFIDWHRHWETRFNAWHGFYCVNVETTPSKTTYRIPPAGIQIINPEKEPYEEIDIISKNNLLVISPSAGDQHRTWPWEGNGEPRITIAFDIVPESKFPSAIDKMNHWIPI